MKVCALFSVCIQLFPQSFDFLRFLFPVRRTDQIGDTLPFKISGRRNAKSPAKGLPLFLADNCGDFLRGKDIIFAFHAVAVRILPTAKAALWVCQLREDIIQRTADHLPAVIPMGLIPCLRISKCQQCIIVEHLLEMGHQPLPVGGISGESAAHMVK